MQKIGDLSTGQRHTCLVSVTGHVYSCGSNEHGQLGLGCFSESEPFPKKVEFDKQTH